MTATPERSDGIDIFKAFDYNIAYEIRLKKAMECNLICPFHYFGISDLEIDGELIDDNTDFGHLISDERARKIKEGQSKTCKLCKILLFLYKSDRKNHTNFK